MNRYYIILGLVILIIIYFISVYYPYKISVKKFNNKINKKQFDYILDVRTPEEWNLGHHKLATLIPIGTFVTELPKLIKNKNSILLIYCKKGIRAEASAKIANRLGYKNVYWMDGTWENLKNQIY